MQNVSKWFSRAYLDEQIEIINKNIYNWLVRSKNLTNSIKDSGLIFSLKLLDQSFKKPYADEIAAFASYDVDCNRPFIRQVFLEGDNKPLIFARVVIPEQTFKAYHNGINNLGSAPIGNTMLYGNKDITRKNFEYCFVKHNDQVSQDLINFNYLFNSKENCLARRSIFELPKGPLLISEFFLKSLHNCSFQS